MTRLREFRRRQIITCNAEPQLQQILGEHLDDIVQSRNALCAAFRKGLRFDNRMYYDFISNIEGVVERSQRKIILQYSINTDGFVMRGNEKATESWPIFLRFEDIDPQVI